MIVKNYYFIFESIFASNDNNNYANDNSHTSDKNGKN